MTGAHQYGMFVFNAWLEQALTGPGGMRDVWALSAARPGDTWDALLADSTDTSAGELWGGFTGAYGNSLLAESDQYTPATTVGRLAEGLTGTLPMLGTDYYRVTADAMVTAEGEVVLAGRAAVGGDGSGGAGSGGVSVAEGDVLAVTARGEGVAYTLHVGPPGDEADTGNVVDEDGDETGSPTPRRGEDEGPQACGCAAGQGAPWGGAGWGVAGWVAALLATRRRSAR